MCEVPVEGRHLVLSDGILKGLGCGLLLDAAIPARVWVCQGKDSLCEWEEGPFGVLRIGTHGRDCEWIVVIELERRARRWSLVVDDQARQTALFEDAAQIAG
jgi:hypothetical protein